MNGNQARSAVEVAERSVQRASAAIDELRELVAAGEPGANSELAKAQKRLAREIEKRENARAAVRFWERTEAQEAEAAKAEAERVQTALRAIYHAKATEAAAKYAAWLTATKAELAKQNRVLVDLEGLIGYRSIIYPARFESFGLLGRCLDDQLAHFKPASNHSSQEA